MKMSDSVCKDRKSFHQHWIFQEKINILIIKEDSYSLWDIFINISFIMQQCVLLIMIILFIFSVSS